jgi:hypothetical protein
MRLIDADALVKVPNVNWVYEYDETGCAMRYKAVPLAVIEAAPTIDAVPVVRCRDCKYWSGRNDKPGDVTAIGYCNHPNHHIIPLNAGWFCADGMKMEVGAER